MADEPPAKLGFGFSKTKAAQRKVNVNVAEEGPEKILLSQVEQGGVFRTLDGQDAATIGQPGKKTYVIAKIENTYKAGTGKFAPSFVPPPQDAPVSGEGEGKFEMAAPVAATVTSYGLMKMERKEEDPGVTIKQEGDRAGLGGSITERLTAERRQQQGGDKGRGGGRQEMKQEFQDDVEELPDMAPVEAYEAMPIEEFGMAMLRGMGWQEGMGVGRNRKVVEAVEYLKRPERLGLGAQAVLEAGKKPKGPRKMGDAPEGSVVRREDLVLAPDADGRQRHIRKLDEKLVKRADVQLGPRPGKEMVVVDGRHEGFRCVVVEVLPVREGRSERCLVRLKPSEEQAEVRTSDLGEVSEIALMKQRQQLEQQQQQRRDGDGDREREREGDGRKRGREEEGSDLRGRDRGDGGSGRERERERDRGRAEDHGGKSDRGGGGGRDRDAGRGGGGGGGKLSRARSEEEEEEEEEMPRDSGRPWLLPKIRVRVVDKKVRGGKIYLKKGVVVDVHPGAVADVRMDESGEVMQLRQSALETVVPKNPGSLIMVVSGPARGSTGKLLQSKSSEGVAAVQLSHDFSVHRLMLDDVCEFVGRLDEDDEDY